MELWALSASIVVVAAIFAATLARTSTPRTVSRVATAAWIALALQLAMLRAAPEWGASILFSPFVLGLGSMATILGVILALRRDGRGSRVRLLLAALLGFATLALTYLLVIGAFFGVLAEW